MLLPGTCLFRRRPVSPVNGDTSGYMLVYDMLVYDMLGDRVGSFS